MTKTNRIHLSDREKSWYSQVCEAVGAEAPFWVIETAQGPQDGSAEPGPQLLQRVVDRLKRRVFFVQVGARGAGLKGTLDLRGQTAPRQLVRLFYHAQGVLCTSARLSRLAGRVESKLGKKRQRPCILAGDGRELERILSWFSKTGQRFLTPAQWRHAQRAIAGQGKPGISHPMAASPPMLPRAFAVVCNDAYYPGLRALLNSIVSYHGREIPVFVYHHGFSSQQLAETRRHPAQAYLFKLNELPFPTSGMWEAKQQILAHCLGRARCVHLLDADLVLVSAMDDGRSAAAG